MKKYRCVVAYDGTDYAGFQIQPRARTIQSTLQEAFFKRLQTIIPIKGASRTDSGVHALGQVIHFQTDKVENLSRFLYQINSILPHSIRILSIEEVSPSFHSRYDAKKKTYYYYLSKEPLLPFDRLYRVVVPRQLDIMKMQEGAYHVIGKHDFRSFAQKAEQGCAKSNPVKTIYRFDFIPDEKGCRVEIEGNGFLNKMVRNLMGTLFDIGMGKIPSQSMRTILEACDRRQAGQTAPAHGLFLAKVDY